MKKIVIFGAGRIGRSFIGQLFSRAGYRVVFIDISHPLIDELNRRRGYKVIIKDDIESVIEVKNVSGIYASDAEYSISEVADSDIIAVSVGQAGLRGVIPLLAAGLTLRYSLKGNLPVDIIIAENLRNAAVYFRNELSRVLPDDYPLDKLVGLIETSIGKMVPFMQKRDIENDPLAIFAESYNTLILDRNAFKNQIPDVKGLDPKENMQAWVDRKLFIHNLGHAALAYYGYHINKNLVFTWEALEVAEIYLVTRETMLQAADILIGMWPDDFTVNSLTEHIDDLLKRFSNKALNDTIYRVGCDLRRKLGPEDRIVGAIRAAQKLDKPYDLILRLLVHACHFRARDDEGRNIFSDIEFARLHASGIKAVLTGICGFSEQSDKDLISLAENLERSIYS